MDWREQLGALLPEDYTTEPEDQTEEERRLPHLTIAIDKKRAGKTATIICGFDADDERCEELAKALRRRLGVGGSARGGEILIQGDHRAKLKTILAELGYRIKMI